MSKLTKIEIKWHGPLTLKEIKKDFADEDRSYGLYQIYGTHTISGPNTLLYIGMANYQTFADRLKQHERDWIAWEQSALEYYVGRLGGTKDMEYYKWEELIDHAERLLIHFCSPPYNSQYIIDYGDVSNTIVFNFGKRNQLPLEISTLYYESKYGDDSWKEFNIDDPKD